MSYDAQPGEVLLTAGAPKQTVDGNQQENQKIELVFPPDPKCTLCRGVGGVKSWGTVWRWGACPKCYPNHPKKAVTFKQYLRRLP